ncbi:MAG: TIGR02444 family protein, partial [Betaproteobacteria bacterium]|nr:TIGR02444 family protein [Betaproteobacteria bacterium]
DVNLLLYLLFIATQSRQVDRTDVARLDALVKTWREQTVLPLRTLRRRLKTGIEPLPVTTTEALRSAIKRSELDAEHIEQDLLQQSAPASTLGIPAASRSIAARANVAAYGAFLGGLPDSPVKTLLDAYTQFRP